MNTQNSYNEDEKEKGKKEKDEIVMKDIDKLIYEKTTLRGIHLSYAFYATLALFLVIIGGYHDLPCFAKQAIGIIFLFLLIGLAKVSRLQAENGIIHKKMEEIFKPTINNIDDYFTGLRGVGDFFHYIILIGITCYFLLKPFGYPIQSSTFFISFAGLFLVLLIVIYYFLAKGDFLLKINKEVETITSQIIFYMLFLFISFIYLKHFLFN